MESTLFMRAPAISSDRERELLVFIRESHIIISNLELLNLAFTHRSYANETSEMVDNNERLEFLGDSVLGMCVADWLFRNLPAKAEGDFSKIKSVVVSEDSLAMIARKLHVDKYLLIGKGEENTGGRDKKALLADCMEALFAACYLDSGFEAAKSFVMRYLEQQIRAVLDDDYHRDYKTSLQEYMQKRWRKVPSYTLVKKTGPEHDYTFFVEVDVNGKVFGPASGVNKKQAEQMAAKLAYDQLVKPSND
ncbi:MULTISPECIES: ribonuclease III [Sphaerochaeta]|jgi:ribonuclease-3|uniref:Ribonuclease 3 n=3 Tax=root TaxID=1 RepID=A0ABY4DFI9_9SPIR|nr:MULTISPECIES: ribonuclease III [Sphaerochaeta]MDT3358550.1 ribonuclease III [Spirochaetota bacterium]NLA97218.1 ribonuclease III [Spirochaetales bacterium]MDD3423137.1 ribonuclease III [Sphaerochaeta sp.]MDD3455960.1 ribonuclease III [Sphaerochaeta sp.]MDD4036766.1 ribonuclease III [Sphaerochaeta sp.]